MIEMARYVHHGFALWEWNNFSRVEAFDVMYLYTRTQSIHTEEYSTFDKVGSKKLLARKSCFV